MFTIIVAILQSFAVSLGVGSSTLAILNFFSAIRDGQIDQTERRMMGIVYVVLRIAMVAILITTALYIIGQITVHGFDGVMPIDWGIAIATFVLFANALLMSWRLMPSTFGPGIQAGSWYTLGILMALKAQGLTDQSLWQVILLQIIIIAIALGVVNLVMRRMKAKAASKGVAA
jgi:hypothetical protein